MYININNKRESQRTYPPIPEACMLTSPLQNIVVIAASTADPPAFSISVPISAHKAQSDVTIPVIFTCKKDGGYKMMNSLHCVVDKE